MPRVPLAPTAHSRRAGSALAVLASSALAACALGSSRDNAAVIAATSFFGATPMTEQLRLLEELGLPLEAVTPPPGVDPEAWAASLPAEHLPTAERVALGRRLYFDQNLSQNGTVACATCHDLTRGFTDRRPVSVGIRQQFGRRNAPTTANAALHAVQFWDGRAATVEEQAGMPLLNPIEMGFASEAEVEQRLRALPEYRAAFRRVYGRPPTFEDARNAIGAFERTLIFLDSPYDRWLHGEQDALSPAAARGAALFAGRAGCMACHPMHEPGALGTDGLYHNVGASTEAPELLALAESGASLDELALDSDASALGRALITRDAADLGAFKTPSLRNVALTGPYMHDGSLKTLAEVVAHIDRRNAIGLDDSEQTELVAFLESLTDPRLAALSR